MKLVKPLKWYGGKHFLAKRIIELIPEHIHYVEPYFGGGSVFLQKPDHLIEGHSEVVNDLNGRLINFWRVLQDEKKFTQFVRLCEATPFAEAQWMDAKQARTLDGVEQAWYFFVEYRQSRQGLAKDFATLSRNRVRRGMNEQVSSWLTAVEGLQEVHRRLQRVVIFDRDAIAVIRSQDGPNTFFYLDPPYLADTRSGTRPNEYLQFEMLESDHLELLNTLANTTSRFILSGYPSPLYNDHARRHGWSTNRIRIDNKASARKSKRIMTECLWRNF